MMIEDESSTLSVSDKLNNSPVSEFIPEVPSEIIYPNELNNFLREQLRSYVQKNGLLQQNLSDLEAQLNESKESVTKLEEKLSSYEKFGDKTKFKSSSQIATSKIVELSKKLREKNSELECFKTKCSKLEKLAFDLKKQLEADPTTNVKEPVIQEIPSNSIVISEEELKKTNEKVTALANKLFESSNQNLQLKNELKLAKKIIQQETGDNFENLQTATNSTGWRGRTQQILDLQQKNADLKEKLKVLQLNNLAELPPASSNKAEEKLVALSKEYEDLKNKHEELKKKYEALKARHKVVDIDFTLLKSKSTMLKEQAVRDQEVIATLLGQLNSSKEVKNDLLSQKERIITKLQTDKKQVIQEMEEYKLVIKNLQKELSEKEAEKEKSLKALHSPRKKQGEPVEAAETDPGREKFIELVESLNQKLKTEREIHAKTQSQLRAEKQKVIKVESLVARMELETTTRSSYSSNSSIKPLDTSLKDQLELAEEQIKALQTRLDLEQLERKKDMQQFAQILKTYEDTKKCDPTSNKTEKE